MCQNLRFDIFLLSSVMYDILRYLLYFNYGYIDCRYILNNGDDGFFFVPLVEQDKNGLHHVYFVNYRNSKIDLIGDVFPGETLEEGLAACKEWYKSHWC